jgi:hypothetical protein
LDVAISDVNQLIDGINAELNTKFYYVWDPTDDDYDPEYEYVGEDL